MAILHLMAIKATVMMAALFIVVGLVAAAPTTGASNVDPAPTLPCTPAEQINELKAFITAVQQKDTANYATYIAPNAVAQISVFGLPALPVPISQPFGKLTIPLIIGAFSFTDVSITCNYSDNGVDTATCNGVTQSGIVATGLVLFSYHFTLAFRYDLSTCLAKAVNLSLFDPPIQIQGPLIVALG